MERIKLIWDFRGPNAEPIAQHHARHLREFATSEAIAPATCGVEMLTPMHHTAYIVVDKAHLDSLRTRLKPNRGQKYSE